LPIYRLLQGQAFEPEHCQAMGIAFENVLVELGLKDRADPLCDLIAQEVIRLGQQGVHEPSQLATMTIKAFKD
jgi:hypothetical protein